MGKKKINIGLYYSKGQGFISILIPKKNGRGYLKSPFGGYHSNERYKLFLRADIDLVDYTHTNDIDGYLHVGTKISWYDEEHERVVNKVLTFLKDLFPQIESWKEVTMDELWDEIELNE